MTPAEGRRCARRAPGGPPFHQRPRAGRDTSRNYGDSR
ncbi:hypothetical protein C7S15_4605 [Burkholderia cepacia]|nr:hypothetical protein [Burkholderia cepacia]